MNAELIEYLKQFLSENRIAKFDRNIALRMNHLQLVLENIYQPHNASAVLRSADCFGAQYIHAIEKKNKYIVNEDIAMGSGSWITLERHHQHENNTVACLNSLKEKGFRVVATSPHKNDKELHDFDVTQKFALVFGTEQEGISEDVMQMADEFIKIPMFGFTESFNISVCAALCMYELTGKIRSQPEIEWQLDKEQKEIIYLDWLRNSIRNVDLIEKEFFAARQQK